MQNTSLIAPNRHKVPVSGIDRDSVGVVSTVVVALILSDICHTIGKIFPESSCQVDAGINVKRPNRSLMEFFMSISKKRSNDFTLYIADGEINLKLRQTVELEERLITWIRLKEVITMHFDLLNNPYLLDKQDFINAELIG